MVEALVDALTGENAGIGFADGGELDSGLADGGIGDVDRNRLVRKGFKQNLLEQLRDVEDWSRSALRGSGRGRLVLRLLLFFGSHEGLPSGRVETHHD